LIRPHDEPYDDVRAVYNATIDKRPAAIAGARDVSDVLATVDFCREHDVLLAIRGGGHNGPGLGTCDGGLVLNLSPMRGIRFRPRERLVDVQGGCTWGDVDHATHGFGLATPSGVISTTGVGGLTLGGGHGYLTRKYGLTVDNLVAADVVLADGRMVTADEERHPDLFWAIRGGGGNFGVVTSFRLRLHPVDTVVAGPVVWPMDRAAELVRWYDGLMAEAGRDVYGFFMTMTVPPGPHFPEELYGEKVCGVLWCHLGSDDEARRDILDRLDEVAEPSFSHVARMPYPALQSAFDDLYPKGLHWYWKGHYVEELSEEAAEVIQHYGERLPTGLSAMHLYPVDGAPNDVAPDATAYRQRDARWSQVFAGVARDAEDVEQIRAWSRGHWQALTPHVGDTAYINFLMADDDDVVRATYGENYDRLMSIKAEYDPTNLFRVNQNIPAAV
jgi:FAD/FMN-containing dehydrogenase